MAFKYNLLLFWVKFESRECAGMFVAFVTHLIPKHTNGASGGNLIYAEPDGGKAGGHSEDKDLGDGAGKLSEHGHPEQVGFGTGHPDPRPDAVERVGQKCRDAQPLLIQEPGDREDKGNVSDHVDH